MPKLTIKKAPPPSKAPMMPPSAVQDFAGKGLAVALAELANERGMHVRDVLECPDRLTEAGLPPKDRIAPWVRKLAHEINRNACDGCLQRLRESHAAGWGPPPEPTMIQVQARVQQVEATEAEVKAQAQRAMARSETRRTRETMTPEEIAEQRQPVVPVAPSRRAVEF